MVYFGIYSQVFSNDLLPSEPSHILYLVIEIFSLNIKLFIYIQLNVPPVICPVGMV